MQTLPLQIKLSIVNTFGIVEKWSVEVLLPLETPFFLKTPSVSCQLVNTGLVPDAYRTLGSSHSSIFV